MILEYVGLPGSGKTTFALAQVETTKFKLSCSEKNYCRKFSFINGAFTFISLYVLYKFITKLKFLNCSSLLRLYRFINEVGFFLRARGDLIFDQAIINSFVSLNHQVGFVLSNNIFASIFSRYISRHVGLDNYEILFFSIDAVTASKRLVNRKKTKFHNPTSFDHFSLDELMKEFVIVDASYRDLLNRISDRGINVRLKSI